MIFSSKLLSSFSLSAIHSFLKYLRYRQTKTSSGNGENIQHRFRLPRCDPFCDLCDHVWVATHTLGTIGLLYFP